MDVTSTGKVGRYRILRVLGRGGMGEVLLAEDEDLGRRVAIKRPFKSAMEDGLARFQVEAKAAILKHPNIPAVYEMGEQDGMPYIAMEFVEGDPLDKIISSGRPLEIITKLNIIRQVCLALGHAHEKGIVHRDIKPANVIVQPDGVAKIIDFGIAKLTNLDVTQGLTQAQQIIGSLHYIAPERFRGEIIDGRADIFSAGVMLYLLLTGHLPFGGSEVTASYKIVNEAHSSLKEHLREYPPALDAIMDKALAKNPYDRYSTAEDFAEALDEVIEELKKSRVGVLFDDAERLAAESRYAPALELLDEAIRLDPNNTQVKKLRKLLREHQERQKRAERTREFSNQADSALAVGNYVEAITALREAQRLDSSSVELRNRLAAVEEQKRRYERGLSTLAEVESIRARGDVTGALRLLDRALAEDAENPKFLTARAVIARQLENEAKQGQVLDLVHQARAEMAAQRLANAQQKLYEAEALDSSHPQVDELRRDLARIKEQEDRRQLMDEIQRRVNEFLRAGNYEAASDLLNRAIEKLPHEAALQRLKLDVDTEARKFDAKRFVDSTLARASDLFANSPEEALALLRKTIEEMPGEGRLIAYERSLRQQADALRTEHEQKQATQRAIESARALVEQNNFPAALQALQTFIQAYGESPEITQQIARVEAARAAAAQELVSRSIEQARAALLSSDYDAALSALQNSAEYVALTDAKTQADWQRLAKSAEENPRKSGKTATAADLLVSEPEAKSTGKTIALALAGCAVIAIGGVVAYRLLPGKNPPPPATTSPVSVVRTQVSYFNASATTINQDDHVTLSWQVRRAASVAIDPISGTYPATGTVQDAPKTTTTYHLKVNGVEAGHPVTVTVTPRPIVHETPKPEPPVEHAKPAAQIPSRPPDTLTLRPIVNAYKTIYEQASHARNEAECKHILTGSYAGALRSLADNWCGSAKSFTVSEKCDQPSGGTADAPTLACEEALVITSKAGNKLDPIRLHKTFAFTRSGDSWIVKGWQ